MSSELAEARYVSLTTYKKSGVGVATPVWCAEDGGDYFIFSAGNAGKVKRLRNSERASLATCDGWGNSVGEQHDARATVLLDPRDTQRALAALRRKYGLQMKLADLGAKLMGRFNKRAYIRVRLEE